MNSLLHNIMLPKLFFYSILSLLIFTHSYSQCLDNQKRLLVELKNELIFDSSFSTKLVQWNQTDNCCKWYGVECDGAGNVISLQLDGESISGGIGDSSSLFRLTYLQKLNLAYNDINYNPIPKGIHNLTYLTHLNLSNAHFRGQVPIQFSSLRRLVSLDISNDVGWGIREPIKLEYPNLEMLLSNMTGLRELYLDRANITSSVERIKWSHIISSYLPNLTTLSLVDCSLSGPLAMFFWQLHSLSILRLDENDLSTTSPDLFANFSNLTTLSLPNCELNGYFPETIFHLPTLQNLDLSSNEGLSGRIPPFTQNGSLKSLILSRTNFTGSLPCSISNHKTLSKIDLSYGKFTGSIPSTFANLTQLVYVELLDNFFTGSLPSGLFGGLHNLVYLALGVNSFSGSIPHSLFRLPSLQGLSLFDNKFSGQVKEFSIVNVSSIVSLHLSSNRLEGPIPDSFFHLQSLELLFLDENMFNGTFQLDKIRSLANITFLDLSRNNLTVDVGNSNSSTYGLPQLQDLRLASCNLHHFPHFIKHSDIEVLDLSDNQIGGEIPIWIWRSQLRELNLSLNLLTHVQKPFHIPASLQLIDLHSNLLRGDLHLPIPSINASSLYTLLLGNNSLTGPIPTSLCSATHLTVVDLSFNRLSGNMPSCLLENTATLSVLDLGRNNISGHIPDNFFANCFLQYLDLNNNILEGKFPKSLKNCQQLVFMNVGNNIIEDTFPCILSSRLVVLVLHSNRFHGEVICQMSWPYLQILDVSSNSLSGSLESINLSSWRAMVVDNDAQLRYNHVGRKQLRYKQFGQNFLKASGSYTGMVRLIIKGLDMQLVKIFPDFTAVDLSCNNFGGEIPNAIANLTSLHLLNLSHNALNGSIPESFGQLSNLESLDISKNQLTGAIPVELAELTFLSVLNMSYNKLVGKIPNGRQLQTFSADSFKGNSGLCGFNLNISCTHHTDLPHEKVEEEKREIEWEYVSAALGYVVGLGSIVWLLLFCRSFRKKYFDKIDDVVEDIFHARDMRRRRRATARRRLVRNQAQAVRRRQ